MTVERKFELLMPIHVVIDLNSLHSNPAFDFVFQRHSPMYKAIVVTPAFVIVSMTLASFWLPPTAGEKLLLNGIACVVICILLMYFSQLLPLLASSSPLIGKRSRRRCHASSIITRRS